MVDLQGSDLQSNGPQGNGQQANGLQEKGGPHLNPQKHPFMDLSAAIADEGITAERGEDGEELGSHIPVVRLRGLPFNAQEQDVLAFFSQHNVADLIVETKRAVRFLFKANDKPSGQAVVQMRSRQDADLAQKALHSQWIGSRYIEVFAYGDSDDEDLQSQPGPVPAA